MKKKLFFIVGLLSFTHLIYSQTAVPPAGSGTQSDPYQIAALENLYWMTQHNSSGTYYVQTADIDASSSATWDGGAGFDAVYFYDCHYDGGGHTITGLYINRPNEHNLGLFRLVGAGATVTNLTVNNASVTGDYNCGIITGSTSSDINGNGPASTVQNCSVSGTVVCEYNGGGIVGSNNYYSLIDQCQATVQINGTDYLQGGIAGHNNNHSQITNSSASGSVNGTYAIGGIAGSNSKGSTIANSTSSVDVSGSNQSIGGIAGRNKEGSYISDCGATGNISGQDKAGGLVGYSYDSFVDTSFSTGNVNGTGSKTGGFIGEINGGSVNNCYTQSTVNGASITGGFAGNIKNSAVVSNSYSTGAVSGNSTLGGFAGQVNNAVVEHSFWNIEASGLSVSAGGTGKSTSEMQSLCTYVDGTDANWDFMNETANGTADFWGLNDTENQGYPFLSWQGFTHTASCGAGIDILTNFISVYPNPAKTTIFIKSKDVEIQQIELLDDSGKIVLKKENISNKIPVVDIKEKVQGLYLLKIRTDKGIMIRKIIIN